MDRFEYKAPITRGANSLVETRTKAASEWKKFNSFNIILAKLMMIKSLKATPTNIPPFFSSSFSCIFILVVVVDEG